MRLNPDDYPWIEIRPHRNVKRVDALNDIDMHEQIEELVEQHEPEEHQCGHYSAQDSS